MSCVGYEVGIVECEVSSVQWEVWSASLECGV